MTRKLHIATVLITTLGLAVFLGCAPSGGGGGGGGTPGGNVDTNGQNDNGAGGGDTAAGFAAFTASNCSDCHFAGNNDFSDSTTDDIVDTLLGDKPHTPPFGDFTEQEIDDITDFLVQVMTGDVDIDTGEPTDGNENDNTGGGEETQAHAWFEQLWTDFDENYSHFETKGVDWDAARTEHEPQFEADLTVDDFLTNIADMLAVLEDLHVWLLDSDGEPVEIFSKPAAQNYPNDLIGQYFTDSYEQWGSWPLYHGWLNDNLAYIGIDSFDNSRWDGLRTSDVDDLFAAYADADGLVLDVRWNNGGDETIAATFAGHLTDTAYVYGYHRTKNPGPDHDDFGDLEEHRLQPADNQLFLKPVACLIGQMNLSSAEWWVLMMRENPSGIPLIGDTTRGSSGFPREFELDNGITYGIPRWEAFRADQTTEIEDIGIQPSDSFAIPPGEGEGNSYTTERDFVLERAIQTLTE